MRFKACGAALVALCMLAFAVEATQKRSQGQRKKFINDEPHEGSVLTKRQNSAPSPPSPPDAGSAITPDGKLTETARKKLLAEINKYRLMHDATPLGYCNACAEAAQKWVTKMAASGDQKPDHSSKYGQTIFSSKDPTAVNKGPDNLGTLVAATWYNQIKSYDFVKNEFKGSTADFTQLVWGASEKVGFASAKDDKGRLYVVAYYDPAGNNETSSFVENVNRVTGAGDVDIGRAKCADEWTASGQACYKLFSKVKSWPDAADHCNGLKSSLVSAENPEEGMFIRSLLIDKDHGGWLGMSDTAMKGGFQFVDGTPYVYSDWSYESYMWLYAHPTEARSKCITASKDGWGYKDCDKKLPFICKMRPNGLLSFSVDVTLPGSSFTNDLATPGSQRYNSIKSSIDKVYNASYGAGHWFVGSTFYQFMPRENGDVAASTLLRFAPDIRAPVDPISRLRDQLRGKDEIKILKVKLIPGVGRVNSPTASGGTCPSGCSGACYPACNPTCCGSAVQLSLPPMPSGYTACSQYPGCGQICQPSCSQQCCMSNSQPPMVMQAVPQQYCSAYPGCSQLCAPQCSQSCCQQQQQQLPIMMASPCSLYPGCSASCAPQCSQQCCQQRQQPIMAASLCSAYPGCSASCAPQCSQQCCQQQQQPMMVASPCSSYPGCSASCFPQCSQQCCQQQQQQPMQYQSGVQLLTFAPQSAPCPAYPSCTASCAPLCRPSCCMQQLQTAPAPVIMAVAMPPQVPVMNTCSAVYPGCSSACAPFCRPSCCGSYAMRVFGGKKRSKDERPRKSKHHAKFN